MSRHISSNLTLSNYLESPSLSIDPAQAETLCNILHEQFLYGHYVRDCLTPPQQAIFVEYGFARHRDAETVIDEPLAILAALRWMKRSTEYSLFKRLYCNIDNHSTHWNGFEACLVFYLRTVFQDAPPLHAIFPFRSDFAWRANTDRVWQYEEFKLVMVVDSRNTPRISVVSPSSGPSPNIGFQAQSGRDVLDWISTNKDQSTFCFPPESFGPDILLFIQSKASEKLLLVLIQAKKYNDVKKGPLIHGVRTINPAWFWKSKDTKVCSFLQAVCICFD